MRYYYPCMPQRLSVTSPYFDGLDNDKGWIAEKKLNGWRCLVYKDSEVRLYTRHKTLVKEPLNEIKEYFNRVLPENTLIDGELIHYRTKEDKRRFYVFNIIMMAGKLVNNLKLS